MPDHSISDLTVGQRPALQRVLPFLTEESFEERFEYGVAKLLAHNRAAEQQLPARLS